MRIRVKKPVPKFDRRGETVTVTHETTRESKSTTALLSRWPLAALAAVGIAYWTYTAASAETLAGPAAVDAGSSEVAAKDKLVTVLYTVNNLGYTATCG